MQRLLGDSQSVKSVHWSPVLIHSRDITLSDSDSSLHMKLHTEADPPRRSIRDELISPQLQSVDSQISVGNVSNVSSKETQQQIAAHWVMVFGFSREDASDVLKLFGRHGTIVSHRFPKEGNWVYIRYASPVHARQALSRNGQIINGRVRLGVLPVDSDEMTSLEDISLHSASGTSSPGIVFSQNRSVLSENSMLPLSPSSDAFSRPLETNFNSSLLSSSTRRGIRSLRAPYYTTDNYYQVDTDQMPEKSGGLFNKLWNLVS
ncbi:unnamed protein product [Thelazia callipaeda]|uniref:Nucleoporin NUP35 n=1 Tax=Thelazia callipaeda TaxID=103827 RepID=A0A0N5CV47_THECL|nr:unnamed protein product [Thelazia callipaeda]